jgi:hypothetical protein
MAKACHQQVAALIRIACGLQELVMNKIPIETGLFQLVLEDVLVGDGRKTLFWPRTNQIAPIEAKIGFHSFSRMLQRSLQNKAMEKKRKGL